MVAPQYRMSLVPRYFFHFSSRGGERVQDPDGMDLADLRVAHRHAMKLIRRTALFTSRQWNAREWAVEVADESRQTLLVVLFPVGAPRPPGGARTGSRAGATARPASRRWRSVRTGLLREQ